MLYVLIFECLKERSVCGVKGLVYISYTILTLGSLGPSMFLPRDLLGCPLPICSHSLILSYPMDPHPNTQIPSYSQPIYQLWIFGYSAPKRTKLPEASSGPAVASLWRKPQNFLSGCLLKYVHIWHEFRMWLDSGK